MSGRTSTEARTFTYPADLSKVQTAVLDLLARPQARTGLFTSAVTRGTGYSSSTVLTALSALRQRGLVSRSTFRTSHGYAWAAVTDEERGLVQQEETLVADLEQALAALTGSAEDTEVHRLVNGGVGLRLSRPVALALLATLRHAVEA